MSNRYSQDVPGRYIPGPNGGSYEIQRVPLPPRATLVRERDVERQKIREYFEVRLACGHCLKDVHFIFPIKEAPIDFITQNAQDASNRISRIYADMARQYERRQDVVVSNYLASVEEFES